MPTDTSLALTGAATPARSRTAAPPDTAANALFLVSGFPAVSETFIWREALSLQSRGGVRFLSLEPRGFDPAVFPEEVARLADSFSFRRLDLREVAGALAEACRTPARYVSAIRLLHRHYPWRRVAGRLYSLLRVRRFCRTRNIGVVHAHWRGPTDIAYLQCLLFGVPFTQFLHAHDIYDEGLGDPLYRPLFESKLRAARCSFTCTRQNQTILHRNFPDARVQLSYHGVPDRLVELQRRRPAATDATEIRLLSVGRLVAYKGFDDVVSIALLLRRGGVKFSWRIIGDGSLRRLLEQDLDRHGLDETVVLDGQRPNADVIEAMSEADLFVFLGRPEKGQYGLPNVLIEAAATALPSVSRPLPTLGELMIPGKTGCIADSVEEIAGQIAALARDRAGLADIGRQAREAVKDRHLHSRHIEVLHRCLLQIAEAASKESLSRALPR